MKDKRPLLVLVALVAIVAGAYYLLDSRSDGSSSGTTPVTTATTLDADANDDATAEDFDTAIDRLVALENELFENPNPNRVSELMLAKCECYTDTRSRLETLDKENYELDGDSLKIEQISFLRSTATTMEGVVRLTGGGGKVVDETGTTVEPAASGAFQPLIYTLEKDQDGVWKIADRSLPEEIVPE